jgi:predicted Rossmann-fold nucleotide-binding protein
MKIIVCGGRDFNNTSVVRRALTAAHAKRPIELLIEGGAAGADRLAREWAGANGVLHVTVMADWKRYGPAAGPLRNAEMLREYQPDGVIAFPGGKGTADMILKARQAGVKVWQPFSQHSYEGVE